MWLLQYARTAGPNFGVVSPGRLYRGSEVTKQVSRDALSRDQGIRTYVDLRDGFDKARDEVEDTTWAKANIIRIALPLADTAPIPFLAFTTFLNLATDEKLEPLFVSCTGGRHRTGAMCAAFRLLVSGWDWETTYKEMVKFGWYPERGHQPVLDSLKAYAVSMGKVVR